MSYTYDFNTLPFRAVTAVQVVAPAAIIDPVVEDQLHTHAYIRRVTDTTPANCTAIYHTADGDWLELDVGPESVVGQRTFPNVKILDIEHLHAKL